MENNRIRMLNKIFGNFQQITQWLPNNIEIANKYCIGAETLIGILEVEDCSSIGGHDMLSPVKNESGFELYDRFLALVRKHNNEKDIKPVCGLNLTHLKKYFSVIHNLRGNLK